MSAELVSSDRAPGMLVAPGAKIPPDAEIAPYVTVYGGVRLGAGVALGQGAILGRAQQVDARSRAPAQEEGAATVLGAGARIGSGTVVTAGVRIGERCYVGDEVLIREAAELAEEVMIGRGTTIHHSTEVGARARIYGLSIIAGATIEDDVLIGPGVTFVADPTMGRSRPDASAGAIVLRRAARVGAETTIVPPAEIGEEAVIGTASLVLGDVPARTVVAGAPAKTLRPVRDDELLEAWHERPG